MAKKPPFGTLEYALNHATRELGIDTVEEVTGHSRSAIYRGTNSDDPLGLGWFSMSMAVELSRRLLEREKAEYFSYAVRRMAEGNTAPPEQRDISPIVLCAEMSHALSLVQKMLAIAGSERQAGLEQKEVEEISSLLQQITRTGERVRGGVLGLAGAGNVVNGGAASGGK